MKDSAFLQLEDRMSEIGLTLERDELAFIIPALDNGQIMLIKEDGNRLGLWMIGTDK